MVSLRIYEGRCLASLALSWRLLQAVRRWIHPKNWLSCNAVCGPCGSTVYGARSQPCHSLCYLVLFQIQANELKILYGSTSINIFTVCYW